MPETVERFISKWQTMIGIVLAAAFGYGMKAAEINKLSSELNTVKEEVRVVRDIEKRLERIEANQEHTNELLRELRQNGK